MRTTLEIDNDVYLYACELAQAQRQSIGKTVSHFLRLGFQAPLPSSSKNSKKTKHDPMNTSIADANGFIYRNGIPMLPADGRVITNELINKIREAEGI